MQDMLDKTIVATRYVLAVFFLGLGVGLALYALRFLWKLGQLAGAILEPDESVFLIALLHLVDSALIGSLIVMLVVSSWDSLVSRLDAETAPQRVSWLAKLDPGNLKIKLATAIVAISSIHLLQIFMRVGSYNDRDIAWSMGLHGLFIAAALALAVMDRLHGSEDSTGEKK